MAYRLANGRTVECEFGLVEIDLVSEVTSRRVIFGPGDAEPIILDATALESVARRGRRQVKQRVVIAGLRDIRQWRILPTWS